MLTRRWTVPFALLAAGASACSGGDTSAPDGPGAGGSGGQAAAPDRRGLQVPEPRALTTRGGEYAVSWQPVGGFVPENEPFEATVEVRSPAGDPVADANVAMDFRMPDHGHGMLRKPKSEALGDGSYRVRGLLLHMGGRWTVTVTVIGEGGVAATADDEVTL